MQSCIFVRQHLDPESVKNLITPPLKQKIESDAMSYNLLKPNAKKGKYLTTI